MTLVTVLILIPLITAAAILCVPGNYRFVIRCLALFGTLETAIWATLLFFGFVPGDAGIQFEQVVPWVSSAGLHINFHVGADGLNVGLILAAALVGFAATCVSWDIDRHDKVYYVLLMLIIAGAIGAFASFDLFFFYFFNELALVPTFIMIGVWGHGKDRTRVAYTMTLYLTLGALVALAGLAALYAHTQTLDVVELSKRIAANPLPARVQAFVFPCLLLGFGTLVGLWPFHSWAPAGYGSAPAATAMMHAGILKKAGLLALLRIAWPFFPQALAQWVPVLAWLCVGNLLYCGFVAMRQRDLNLLLGNSSLAHMGFAFLGLASVNVLGVTGAGLVMVAHAFLAALSFGLSGWLRRQTGILDIGQFGGLLARMPFAGAFMVACFLAGCGVPGFAGFAGEVTVLFGAWKGAPVNLHWVVVAAAWGGLILGGVYMLRAIRSVLHGPANPRWREVADTASGWRQLPFAILLAALILFGMAPGLLSRRIAPVAAEIVKGATAGAGKALVSVPAAHGAH